MADNIDLNNLTEEQRARITEVLNTPESAHEQARPVPDVQTKRVESPSAETSEEPESANKDSIETEKSHQSTTTAGAEASTSSGEARASVSLAATDLQNVLNDSGEFERLLNKAGGAKDLMDMANGAADSKE